MPPLQLCCVVYTGPMKIFFSLIVMLLLSGTAYYVVERNDEKETRTAPIRIVALGDSLTAGYGVSEEENYPNQLKLALSKYPIEIKNLGVNGDTTAGAKERLDRVMEEKPDIVILGIGGNDALRLVPIADIQANIESIVETLRSQPNPPRIVLLQMQTAIQGGMDYKREFDKMYEKIADRYDLPLVPFILTKIYLDPKYVLSDRIHMNAAGYAYVVNEYLKETVEQEIRKLK